MNAHSLPLACFCSALTLACGAGENDGTRGPDGGRHTEFVDANSLPDASAIPAFRSIVPTSNAALHITGSLEPGNDFLDVEVRAYGLGRAFGAAFHVRYDIEHLELAADPDGEAAVARFGGRPDASLLLASRPGDLAFGITRSDPALGDVAISDDSALLALRFAIRAKASTSIAIERHVVRRSDGSYVPTMNHGAELVFSGGAR